MKKGPLISQQPLKAQLDFTLYNPKLKSAQDKLDTICQNLPESSATSA